MPFRLYATCIITVEEALQTHSSSHPLAKSCFYRKQSLCCLRIDIKVWSLDLMIAAEVPISCLGHYYNLWRPLGKLFIRLFVSLGGRLGDCL